MAMKSDVLEGFVDAQVESLLKQTRAEAQATFPGPQRRQSTFHAHILEVNDPPATEQARSQFGVDW
jgi:hypothetical protein